MILRTIIILTVLYTNLFSLATSSDDEYKVIQTDKYSIIYTPTNEKEAKYIKSNLDKYLKSQDKSFGFSFDEPIIISLISPNIQIANAFSTQIPFNETLLYGGGVQYIDYFSSVSWLDTLLYHEISHNYQINSKNNEISTNLHKFLGNNYMPLFVPIPLFTLPNLLLPTAILEGNAVLNESIHSNGGRLHSGRFKALTNLLVLHNKMDKTIFINDHLDFPYGEEKYIVGGYYMLYLSNMFGVDRVNKFFEEHSKHFANPLRLNDSFKKHFQISFDDSFKSFLEQNKKDAKAFNPIESKEFIASSKKEIYLSKKDEEILFLTNDNITKPILNRYDLSKDKLSQEKGSWLNGKVFKIEDKYYSANATYIKSTLYKSGLFDGDRFIKKDTIGKFIQDIFEEHQLYFDVSDSFDTPSLYLNGVFYDKANSSALFDQKGNIYYFKQEKDKRVLYKNKGAIFSFEGYFSKVVDIVDGTIYFIANSKNGSSLYKYDEKISRLSTFDNLIDAKIINENEALVVSINHDNYRAYKINLLAKEASIIPAKLKLSDKEPFGSKDTDISITSRKYNEVRELDFSYLYPTFSYDSEEGSLYTLNAYFLDPLMFNMLGIYAYKYEDERYTGFNYINERYIPFEINLYDASKEISTSLDRQWGGYLKVYSPLYKEGSHIYEIDLQKYFDDDNKHKDPYVLTNAHTYELDFGASYHPYFKSQFELYLKEDREDFTYGLSLDLTQHLFSETYLKGSIKAIKSDTNTLSNQRGVKIYEDALDNMDNSDIYSAGLDDDIYVKDITKSTIGLSKTINLDKYFFTFPLSIRRESIYLEYSDYTYTQDTKENFNEKILGITFDTLLVHKISMPIDIKYIENSLSKDDSSVLFSIGVSF